MCETLLSELLGLVMALAPAGRRLLLSGVCGGPGWSHCCPLLILGLLRISKADQNRWGGRGSGKSLKKADKLPKVIITIFCMVSGGQAVGIFEFPIHELGFKALLRVTLLS